MAALLYASSGVLVRVLGHMWGDKAQVAIRFLLVSIMLVIHRLVRSNKPQFNRQQVANSLFLGIAFSGVVLFFTASIQKTSIANAMFTFYAGTMISSFIFGSLFFKETVTKRKIIAILMALAGLAMYSGAIYAGTIGVILGVLAGISDGFGNIFRKKLKGADHLEVLRIQFIVGTIFCSMVMLASGEKIIKHASLSVSLATILFSVVILIAALLVLYGFQHFDINIGTVILSSEIVSAALLAYIFYGEVPAINETIGGLFILAAAIASVPGKASEPD